MADHAAPPSLVVARPLVGREREQAALRDGPPLTSQDAIIRRVLAYLAALTATRPLVILLEDLHWADAASLDVLRLVGRGLAGMSLHLIGTYRADEVVPDHPLAALLPSL